MALLILWAIQPTVTGRAFQLHFGRTYLTVVLWTPETEANVAQRYEDNLKGLPNAVD